MVTRAACVETKDKDVADARVSQELNLGAVGRGVVDGEEETQVGEPAEAIRDELNPF
jgi:hypothetical protein